MRRALFAAIVVAAFAAPLQAGWTWIGPGNVAGRIRALLVHPHDAKTVWAGSPGGGIWKTTDGGATWTHCDDHLPTLEIASLALDPTNPNILYAGTGEGLVGNGSAGVGVLRSTDGGSTWERLPKTSGADWQFVNGIAADPFAPSHLAAATQTGIFQSRDSGTTWTRAYSGRSFDVVFSPVQRDRLFASTLADTMTSADSGTTWTKFGWPFASRTSFAFSPNRADSVFALNDAAFYRSDDRGATFTLIASTNLTDYLYTSVLWVDPTNADHIIAGGIALYESLNGGATFSRPIQAWQNTHEDHHAIIASPAYDGVNDKTLYIATDSGVVRTSDFDSTDRASWTNLSRGLGTIQFYVVSAGAGLILGGTQDTMPFRYSGSGTDWTPVPNAGELTRIAQDPTDPRFYWMNDSGNVSRTVSDDTFHEIWVQTHDRDAALLIDPNDPNTVYIGGETLLRCRTGKEKQPYFQTVARGYSSAYHFMAAAIPVGHSEVVWTATNLGDVYLSTNATSDVPTFTKVRQSDLPPANPHCTDVAVDPNDWRHAAVVFADNGPRRIFLTRDAGATWTNVSAALPDLRIWSVKFWPHDGNVIYAGTDRGLYVSANDGRTWSGDVGPAATRIMSMTWLGDDLVLGTYGRGAFRGTPPLPRRHAAGR